MTAWISFFPVDNGDMTLIELDSGRHILIDVNIRPAADDSNNMMDVATQLRDRLKIDYLGRLYIDVFVLSYPDQAHCRGLSQHFHLSGPEEYQDDENKIFIREIWSSPMIFRRADPQQFALCGDVLAFRQEVKRRVQYYRQHRQADDGNRILILGEDEAGKTDDLTDILIKVDSPITRVNGVKDRSVHVLLLGPLPPSATKEAVLGKSRSSVILAFSLKVKQNVDVCRFLTCGDANVAIWRILWQKHRYKNWLDYDILKVPHHCSWTALSEESWIELGNYAKVNQAALSALSQAREGAYIIASSQPISNDDIEHPCIGAKRAYQTILERFNVSGRFVCTGEYPTLDTPDVMEFEITEEGPRPNDHRILIKRRHPTLF